MSHIYDNWEKLVDAVLKKQQFWELCHQQSRTPSARSEASGFTPGSSFNSSTYRMAVDASSGSSFRWEEDLAKLRSKLVLVSKFGLSFDIEDVFLVSLKLLGRGTVGSAYTAALENGVTIVVKRLKNGVTSEVEFKRYMELIGNFKHENVVPLRAYYSSEDERVMLYDYHASGSVSTLLHGLDVAPLDWETRLKIAIGAARGIAEIHAQNHGNFVHGNIKASNVFINSQQYGCISDFGLASMIATEFLPTAKCYAPEIKNKTQNISQESDVYSFGILLLELLTKKSAVSILGGPKAVDLVKMVTSIQSKLWASKVFDVELLNCPSIKDQMVKLLQIGLLCVAKSPKKRPKMCEVKKMIEGISTSSQIPASYVKNDLVFFQDDIYNIDDLFMAYSVELGYGTFGYCLKVLLGNGKTIVVKRLQYVTVSRKEFQTEMEIIGRMKHENIAELRAYYYSEKYKLMVYDYYNQDTLSTALHGSPGDKKSSLDWGTRLKIACSAAKGIAHIHEQDGVHGNIKCSNIFLNRQKHCLISDTGHSKFISPNTRTYLQSSSEPGYWAPEITNNSKRIVSQASDVYSFGVVLLELVSGKPSQLSNNGGSIVYLVQWAQSVLTDAGIAHVLDKELQRDVTDDEPMLLLLQIGINCVAVAPGRRPRMPQVVKMLGDITLFYQREQPYVESGLECLLEGLLNTLIQ